MAISLVSTPTTFASGANATTVTNNVPGSVANGDFLLWIIDGNVATQPATPTGWAVFNAMVTTTAQGLTIFSRTAASEPASYSATVAAGKWNGIMVAYRGVDATTPSDVTPTSVAANAPPSLASITTVTAGALVCGAAGYNTLSGVTTSAWSSSTGTVEAQTTETLAAVNVTSALMDQATTTAGAVSPNLVVSPTTGSRSTSVTFALRPAATVAGFISNQTRRVQRIAPKPTAARHHQPVPPQAAANTNQQVWQARARRKFGLSRRGHAASPPWPQPAVPVASSIPDSGQSRALRGWRLARSRRTEVSPPQFNPPYPFAPISRRPARLLRPARGRHAEVTPAQVVVQTLVYPFAAVARRAARAFPVRRGRAVTPTPPQVNPPYPFAVATQRRALRGLLARHGRRAEVTPAQQAAPTNPVFVTGRNQVRALRGWLVRHGKQFTPTPAQQAPVPAPVKVWQAQPKRLRLAMARRKSTVTPTGQQSGVITQQRRRPTAALPVGRRRTLLTLAAQLIAAVAQLRGSDGRSVVLAAVSTDSSQPEGTDLHNARATGTADHSGHLTGKDD